MPLARGQTTRLDAKPVRVGLLRTGSAGAHDASAKLFIATLRERGWSEGRNVFFDYAYAERDQARLPQAAAELLARRPDLIYAQTGPEAVAAFGLTRSIPIVFAAAVDPVELGLVKSLAQPSGNVTGVATLGWQLGGKRMQLLKDAMPKITRVGVLASGRDSGREAGNSNREQKLIQQAAGTGAKTIVAKAKTAEDLDAAFALLAANRAEALLVTHNVLFFIMRKSILELAARHRIPVVGHRSQLADDGALMTYSSSLNDQIRRAAQLVDKVLRGAKPPEIPVEYPTEFELVVNLKTARALGMAMPQSILLQASRVIE